MSCPSRCRCFHALSAKPIVVDVPRFGGYVVLLDSARGRPVATMPRPKRPAPVRAPACTHSISVSRAFRIVDTAANNDTIILVRMRPLNPKTRNKSTSDEELWHRRSRRSKFRNRRSPSCTAWKAGVRRRRVNNELSAWHR